MKLSDFHILYINLDRRPERRNNIEVQFSKLNLLNVTRISAIYVQLIDQNNNEFAKEFTLENLLKERMFFNLLIR